MIVASSAVSRLCSFDPRERVFLVNPVGALTDIR